MKSLVSIIETVLNKDAGTDEQYTLIDAALKPLYTTWINDAKSEDQFDRKCGIRPVAKPTAIQVVKKMISNLEKAGAYDYKNHYEYKLGNGFKILQNGNGVLIVNGYRGAIESVEVYYMLNGVQHLYVARFKLAGVVITMHNQHSSKPAIADAGALNGFEIPGEIAEKIIKASKYSK